MAFIKKVAIIYTLVVLALFATAYHVVAQTASPNNMSLGVAKLIDLKNKNIKDGTIISATDKGPAPSTLAYDPQVIGVVARDAAILLSYQDKTSGLPVISTGQVYMLVSAKEGNIKKGDLLASSTIP